MEGAFAAGFGYPILPMPLNTDQIVKDYQKLMLTQKGIVAPRDIIYDTYVQKTSVTMGCSTE